LPEKSPMKSLTQSFLLGLTILLPVMLSIQLIIWFFGTAEGWLKPLWVAVLSEEYYFPGLAIISFVVLVTAIGISARMHVVSQLWGLPGKLLQRIPLVHYVYNLINDFLDLMAGKNFSDQSVVWVTLPGESTKLIGIITTQAGDSKSKLSALLEQEEVAVFLPMSYQAGGYMVVVPRSRVTEIDMRPGEALSLIMSAGLGRK
jgi:uncharacterized membrane protein